MNYAYYSIPMNNNDFKLLIIIGFDIADRTSKLILKSLKKREY